MSDRASSDRCYAHTLYAHTAILGVGANRRVSPFTLFSHHYSYVEAGNQYWDPLGGLGQPDDSETFAAKANHVYALSVLT